MELTTLSLRLRSLTVYRSLLTAPALHAAGELLDDLAEGKYEKALDRWGELVSLLQAAGAEDLGAWLWDALRYDDGPWALAVEAGRKDPALERAARRDVETLSALCALDRETLLSAMAEELPPEALDALPGWSGGEGLSFQELKRWYRDHGAGPFGRCRAFLWDGGELLPVPDPDVPRQEELIGYRLQRRQVEDNTRALLSGRRVNNVLLFGESGTGKSATVKSLLSLPESRELRLIEIEKSGVTSLPRLMRTLSPRRQKFILFIDDLAFDQDDLNYSVLKTILEGGLEPRPDNVAIYATSNRRNLVRQTFSDRAGDEVDREETIQEKTALADRFGLRVPYLSLTKAEYLELVDHLARQAKVDLPPEELRERAVRWDVRHPGRSPRAARQFIDSL